MASLYHALEDGRLIDDDSLSQLDETSSVGSGRDRSRSADLSALPSSPARYKSKRRREEGGRARALSIFGALENDLKARLGRGLRIRVVGAFLVTLLLEGINYTVLALTADLNKKENGCSTGTVVTCALIMVLQLLVIVLAIHHLVTRSWVVKLREAWLLYFTTTLVFSGEGGSRRAACVPWVHPSNASRIVGICVCYSSWSGIYSLLWAVDHTAITHSSEIDKYDSSSTSVLASQMMVGSGGAARDVVLGQLPGIQCLSRVLTPVS